MQSDVIAKIKAALSAALGGKSMEDVQPEMRLKEEVGLDSMTSLTFLMALEEKINGFSVDPETLESHDLETIKSVALYVEKQLNH
jgi:acyl carrier protein